jgi:anti-anti-sigma regulatory factor
VRRWRLGETIVAFVDSPPTLHVSGSEDRNTQGCRNRAFTRAKKASGDVVADLSELDFADSSLMVDLAMLSRNLRLRDRGLRVRGARPQIQRLIETIGLDRLPGVTVEISIA